MAHTVTVREVMSSDYIGVHEGERVGAVAEVLAHHGEESVVVLDGREPVGIAAAVDLLSGVLDGGADTPIGSVMHIPVPTVESDATIERAIELLLMAERTCLVVIDTENQALGTVDARGLLTAADGLMEEHLAATIPSTGERSPPSISEQGVCESCGRLSDTLNDTDGRMLCVACADL